MLLSVLADHFVFIGLHLLLTADKSSLFVHRENHVGLSLLHFQVLDASHLAVLRNHSLDDSVDLVAFLEVLSLSLSLNFFVFFNLLLNLVFVLETVLLASLFGLTLNLVLDFFSAQHDLVDLSVLFLKTANATVSSKSNKLDLPVELAVCIAFR